MQIAISNPRNVARVVYLSTEQKTLFKLPKWPE